MPRCKGYLIFTAIYIYALLLQNYIALLQLCKLSSLIFAIYMCNTSRATTLYCMKVKLHIFYHLLCYVLM